MIASRTPEGVPNRCPVCGHDLKLEPSRPTLDAPCPHCGHLLWFTQGAAPEIQRQAESVAEIVEARFGPLTAATRLAIDQAAASGRLTQMLRRAVRCSCVEELVASS